MEGEAEEELPDITEPAATNEDINNGEQQPSSWFQPPKEPPPPVAAPPVDGSEGPWNWDKTPSEANLSTASDRKDEAKEKSFALQANLSGQAGESKEYEELKMSMMGERQGQYESQQSEVDIKLVNRTADDDEEEEEEQEAPVIHEGLETVAGEQDVVSTEENLVLTEGLPTGSEVNIAMVAPLQDVQTTEECQPTMVDPSLHPAMSSIQLSPNSLQTVISNLQGDPNSVHIIQTDAGYAESNAVQVETHQMEVYQAEVDGSTMEGDMHQVAPGLAESDGLAMEVQNEGVEVGIVDLPQVDMISGGNEVQQLEISTGIVPQTDQME